MSTSQATCEAMWLGTFLTKLDFKQEGATILLIDSQRSISLIKNPIHHNWLKHINIRHHYVRELVHASEITFEYCSTNEMSANMLMKGIPRRKRHECM